MNLETLQLAKGAHNSSDSARCAMEAVAFLAGEPHSDHPACASKVIGAFVRKLNDRWGDNDRQLLKPYLPRIIGTATTLDVEIRRAFMCADWAVRECLPMLLDAIGESNWAALLRDLPEVVDERSAWEARSVADFCLEELRADAYDAAADAAAAAYAYDAAADAAAAAYAADAAAYAAAYAAATAAAAEEPIRNSALALLDQLIRVTEVKS